MGKFKRFSRGGFGGRDSGRSESRGPFRQRDRPDRREPRHGRSSELEMFEATCDKCGKRCEVPFRPRGDKPVYCSDCFRSIDSGPGKAAASGELEQINRKLDKILKALKIE